MTGRIVGVLTLLALVGGAIGYAVGENRPETVAPGPVVFATPRPLPAVDPSYPVNEYDVRPDPTTAPLATGLPLRTARFRAGGFTLQAPVPKGWRRGVLGGRTQWNFVDPDNPLNTYVLRIGIVAGERKSPGVATIARVAALQAQESDGNSENLVIRTDDDGAGFTASLIDLAGYRRVAIERFETLPDEPLAYYTVALSGREVDREGMADLLARVIAGARP